jgi:hypothetical protein
MRKAIIALLVTATVALAFIQIDDTHTQTILAGIKTFIPEIRFQATGGGTEYVGLVAPAVVNTPSVTYKLPQNDGTSGQAIVTDGAANLSFASVAAVTPTPLVFGTPGDIAVFSATELGTYPGTACTPPALALSSDKSGAWTCATPVPAVQPTDTPLIDLLYSGKLNLGADVSGTPLGLVTITANATPAPHDRVIKCAPPNATPVAYTMPAATGSGRVIDMINTTGSGSCSMNRAGGDAMNSGITDTLASQWNADTCYDIASAQWACRNLQ